MTTHVALQKQSLSLQRKEVCLGWGTRGRVRRTRLLQGLARSEGLRPSACSGRSRKSSESTHNPSELEDGSRRCRPEALPREAGPSSSEWQLVRRPGVGGGPPGGRGQNRRLPEGVILKDPGEKPGAPALPQ